MTENTENMVLRTVYLPVDVDRQLKRLAFSLEITKNELIRTIVREGLKDYAGQTFGERLEAAVAVEPAKPARKPRPSPKTPAPARQVAFEPAE